MSIGLIALLDDIAAIAKVAAASLDDVASQAAKAGVKAAGVVIDDTAVTPSYVIGFAAARELPIVGKIAAGSLRNKLLILLPAALALSYFLPWAITPLLMFGGAYLCYEGVEKVFEAIMPHRAHSHEAQLGTVALNAQTVEDEKVASAIKTDFILSAEIMAIALASLEEKTLGTTAAALVAVAFAITIGVYGVVALIVKLDDIGLHLAQKKATRQLGNLLVHIVPKLLSLISGIGTAAMLWVGGGILVHGLEELHLLTFVPDTIHHLSLEAAAASGGFSGLAEWLVTALGGAVVGMIVGSILAAIVRQLTKHPEEFVVE